MINYRQVADYIRSHHKTPTVKDQIVVAGAKTAIVFVLAGIAFQVGGSQILAGGTDPMLPDVRPAQDRSEELPVNSPDWSTHQDQARKVCKGPAVPSGDKVFASHVVVVKMNGRTVRMGLDRAFKMNQNEDTNVWVIGVCKRDILDNPLN
jgi:hypothetical protein